jgi:hypothetical protein
MRYAVAEKLEIIRLVEQSSLSQQRRRQPCGSPGGARVWNKLPVAVTQALELALKEPQLLQRELAVSSSTGSSTSSRRLRSIDCSRRTT